MQGCLQRFDTLQAFILSVGQRLFRFSEFGAGNGSVAFQLFEVGSGRSRSAGRSRFGGVAQRGIFFCSLGCGGFDRALLTPLLFLYLFPLQTF